MKVYFSHTGLQGILPSVEVGDRRNIREIIDYINSLPDMSGLKPHISNNGKLSSSARIFSDILVEEFDVNDHTFTKYFESSATCEWGSMGDTVPENAKNVMISLFEPGVLLKLLDQGTAPQDGPRQILQYIDVNGMEKIHALKPTISNIEFEFDTRKEYIHEFQKGEASLESLKIPTGSKAHIEFNKDEFDKLQSKLLPEDMVEAIRSIWELSKGEGTLRLFQEDALFFIMARLLNLELPKEKQLLLSMPTGGGKTEAFMIPLLSHIYLQKKSGSPKGIQSIIIYPTNALANDQAMRFVELLYIVNRKLSEAGVSRDDLITIGILSGDTPNHRQDLIQESLIKICPRCGKSDQWDIRRAREDGILVCGNTLENGEICGTSLDFCRLRKEDILKSPPDILITNPDEINFALQSPKYLPILQNKIGSIIFDEVHIYQGIFGCHIAHLLRRLEETMLHKPLYIGMSATIGNAKELAALLFDEPLNNIRYIKNENQKYLTDTISKTRLHALIKPYLRKPKDADNELSRNKYVRTLTVAMSIGLFIAHMITDSHFRKSIIFTNYRADADDLAGFLRERETLDVQQYYKEILTKIENRKPLDREELEICEFMHQWSEVLMQSIQNINWEMKVGWNRGGLEKEERIRSVHSFSRNSILSDKVDDAKPIDIMVATKSLEVGIDIGDVSTVINSSAPFTINEYVQRVGRAGRKKDSLAITISNPENAIDSYMKKHFTEYVDANPDSFEDAPIIINNIIIIEKHVKARIADYFTQQYLQSPQLVPNVALQVTNVVQDIVLLYEGIQVKLGKNVGEIEALRYADVLYESIYGRQLNQIRLDERLLSFIYRESEILGNKHSELTKEHLKQWTRETITEINQQLQEKAKNRWEMNQNITGFDSVMPSISPTLRGSGATVSLYLSDNESDNAVDVVPRQTAFSSMPVASGGSISTTKSGVSTFRIVDNKEEQDIFAATEIKKKVIKDERIMKFFRRKISGFPVSEDPMDVAMELSVVVPKKLRVSYYPSRFYCAHCRRSLIPHDEYEQRKNGVYCKYCGQKARQLHKVHICKDPDCGKLYEPPAPRMCINPNCSATKIAYKLFVQNGYKHKREMFDCFRFRLTRDLEWVCETCGCKMNFSSKRDMYAHNSNSISASIQMLTREDHQSIEGMCYSAMMYPEIFKDNRLKAPFYCSTQGHKVLTTVGVPRVRTIAYNYVGERMKNERPDELCDELINPHIQIRFSQGFVIQLADEFFRRFSSGAGNNEIHTLKTEKIFEHQLWGNYYESHLAWINIGIKLDEFLIGRHYSCSGDCTNCSRFENTEKLDMADLMRPRRMLEDYNFDSSNKRPKKPDLRGRYCITAKNNDCNQQWCHQKSGSRCSQFKEEAFLRYIIVHTLKHSILSALPKYVGVNVSEIRGEIYPNDHESGADLVLIDNNEGGSGAILLMQKHWDDIWSFSKEAISLTRRNEANIILPTTCSRNNADLCPFITDDFIHYLDGQPLNDE